MRTIKKTFAGLLAVLMLLSMCSASFTALATDSGACGDNVTWWFENSALIISGTGAMNDYGPGGTDTPWALSGRFYNSVEIRSGVTHIGDYAFYGSAIELVIIPDSVSSIGTGAFCGCSNLCLIHFDAANCADLTAESDAFSGCNANVRFLTVAIGESVQRIPAYLFYVSENYAGLGWELQNVQFNVGGNNGSNVASIGQSVFNNNATVADIYYIGTQQEWDNIPIGANNDALLAAPLHCYPPETSVCFGSYPQSKVTDAATLAALNALSLDWQSYGYYSGTGSSYDGQMTASNYMRYADVDYNGAKYRAVVFDSYRPTSTGSTSSADDSYQDDNSYDVNTVYWFRYEPLEWRVIDPATGLVMCTTIIDSQPYNNYVKSEDTDSHGFTAYWGDSAKTHYASDYANSSLRQWLNDDFYNTAFSAEEKSSIAPTILDNTGFNTQIGNSNYTDYDSASTTDNVFLLSFNEVRGSYVFPENWQSESPGRMLTGSDYARSQGLWNSSEENYNWLLRSPGRGNALACVVLYDGRVRYGYSVNNTNAGIAPALRLLDLGSQTVVPRTFTLTYDANGGTGAPTAQTGSGLITLAGELPTRDGYTFFGWSDQADSNSVQYQPNGDYELTANATIYAVWLENTHTWDTITFGSYPQSKVTDETTLAALNALALNWQSYGYYSGTGSHYNGQMTASDYMRYADAVYNGAKYRAVVFDSYRPFSTGYPLTETASYQDNNDYNVNTVYWFRYDPLEWRVLDEATGLVMCSTVIDSQPYNNYVKTEGTDSHGLPATWGDPAKTYYSCDYANSDLRQWLNDDFYNTAFSAAEKSIILPTTLDNSGYYTLTGQTGYEEYDGAPTTDNVFLLSYTEVQNSAYGFAESNSFENPGRMLKGSDYAKCQGLYSGYVYKSWWLRSPGYYSDEIYVVEDFGNLSPYNSACVTITGVAPALRLSEIPTDEPPQDTYSLSVGDQVAVNLVIDLAARNLDVSDVSITMDGQPVETSLTNDGDQYCFTIITAPAQIADEIVITVGDETITTTVMDYCVALCGHEYDEYEKEQNLAKAILHYGKAANDWFDWTDEEITTFGELDHQPIQDYIGARFTDSTHQITSASFMALAKPEFRFYMSGVTEAQAAAYNSAGITAAYRDTNNTEELHARFKKAVKDGQTVVLVEVTGVSAENMNEEVVVNIPGLGQFTFNGNAFAKAMANDSDPATQALGAALFNYGVAAYTCFKG